MTRRALGICVASLVVKGIPPLMMMSPFRPRYAAMELLLLGNETLISGIGLALALELHDLPMFRGHAFGRRVAVALAAAATVAVTSLLVSTDLPVELGITASASALRLYLWWYNGMVAMVAISFLSQRRGSIEVEQRNVAMADRLAQAGRRLANLGARTGVAALEPQVIFDCLLRARRAYPVDRLRGDAVLGRLAHYLRLTFDAASTVDSTLGREAEIATARLDLERAELDAPMTTQLDSAAAMTRFPPGLLVALTRDWTRYPAVGASRAINLQADRDSRALRVRLDGPCPPPEALQRHAAERLSTFASGRAHLRVESQSLHMEIIHA